MKIFKTLSFLLGTTCAAFATDTKQALIQLPEDVLVSIFNHVPQTAWDKLLMTAKSIRGCVHKSIQHHQRVYLENPWEIDAFTEGSWTSEVKHVSTAAFRGEGHLIENTQTNQVVKLLEHCSGLRGLDLQISRVHQDEIFNTMKNLSHLTHLGIETKYRISVFVTPNQFEGVERVGGLIDVVRSLTSLRSLRVVGPLCALGPQSSLALLEIPHLKELSLGLEEDAGPSILAHQRFVPTNSPISAHLSSLRCPNATLAISSWIVFPHLKRLEMSIFDHQLSQLFDDKFGVRMPKLSYLNLQVETNDASYLWQGSQKSPLSVIQRYKGQLDLICKFDDFDFFIQALPDLSLVESLVGLHLWLNCRVAQDCDWHRIVPSLRGLINLQRLKLNGGFLTPATCQTLSQLPLSDLRLKTSFNYQTLAECLTILGESEHLAELQIESILQLPQEIIPEVDLGTIFTPNRFRMLRILNLIGLNPYNLIPLPESMYAPEEEEEELNGSNLKLPNLFLRHIPSVSELHLTSSQLEEVLSHAAQNRALLRQNFELPLIDKIILENYDDTPYPVDYTSLIITFPNLQEVCVEDEVKLRCEILNIAYGPYELPAEKENLYSEDESDDFYSEESANDDGSYFFEQGN